MATLGFACACGRLRGRVREAGPATVTRIRCRCGDCRAAYTHLGKTDPGAVDLIQTAQDLIEITEGIENLNVFRHTPRGALRWYAACCGTPLFLTPLKPRLVHASVNADRLDDPAAGGKVVAEAFLPASDGKTRHKGALRMVMAVASRIASRNLNGAWRDTPFFGADGAPIRTPHVLSREERAAALMGVGDR